MDKRIIFVLIIVVAIIAILFSFNNGNNIDESISTEYNYEIGEIKFNIPNDFFEDTDTEKEIFYDDLEVYDDSSDFKFFTDKNNENFLSVYVCDLNKYLEDHNNSKDFSEALGENATLKRVNGNNCFVVNNESIYFYVYNKNDKAVSVASFNETLIEEVIV